MKKIICYMTAGVSALSTLAAFAAEQKIPTCIGDDTDGIMSKAYWDLWNPEVQRKIEADIEANRKADACFKIGKIADGTKVNVEQISHDFKFGAHIFNFDQLGDPVLNAKYRALYGTLFNSATVSFYWNKFEPTDGHRRFAATAPADFPEYWAKSADPKGDFYWRRPPSDPIVDYCKRAGVRVHGHPLIWGERAWHFPSWLFDKCLDSSERAAFERILSSPMVDGVKCSKEKYKNCFQKLTADDLDKMFPKFGENLRREFEKRIVEIAKHYGDKVDSWDVVNESLPDSIGDTMNVGGKLMKSQRYKIMPADYTYEAFKVAQKSFPEGVKLNINDSPYRWIDHYKPQIENLEKRGCKIDIVGVQMHIFKPELIAKYAAGTLKNDIYQNAAKLTPSEVWKITEKIGDAHPIHMSEITIAAPDTTPKGQMIQAVVVRNMYRLWFSLKPVMGITWWNVVDDCGAKGEPSISGLFTRGMNPKPAFFALDNLVNNEWKTKQFSASPDSDGNVKFRGFRGNYRASWIAPDGSEKSAVFALK